MNRTATNVQAPSVLTSEVYNEAELIFNLLQNKDKLISLLDCTTLLRGMGMNPTEDDIAKLKERMAGPIVRLEQYRREEELRRDKERRKEERKNASRGSVAKLGARKSVAASMKGDSTTPAADEALTAEQKAAKIVPAEELKNIDWNIFISCAEEFFRDSATEEKAVRGALAVFEDSDQPGVMTRDRLIEVVTRYGNSVLTPAEVKLVVAALPEQCSLQELAARLQGSYVPPTQEELDRKAAEAAAERKRLEEAAKAAEQDPLADL